MTDSREENSLLVRARAKALDIDLSPDCQPGVLNNTALLTDFTRLLQQHHFADTCEPAAEYEP